MEKQFEFIHVRNLKKLLKTVTIESINEYFYL